MLEKIRTLLTAAPTWLTGLAVVVSAFSEEIGSAFPDSANGVARVVAPVLAGIAAAIAIVRRVTPVLPADRGLTPPTH